MGLYSIIPRSNGTVLTADIWNEDHQNHVIHTEPESVNSWEPDVTTMNLETNPFPAGVASLTNSMSGELQRIRYVLSEIKGALLGGTVPAHWYIPTADVTTALSLGVTTARKFQSTAQTIANDTVTIVNFDTTVYSKPSTIAALPALLTAPVDGVYLVGGCAGMGDDDFGPPQDFQLALNRETTVLDVPTTIVTSETFSDVSTDTPKMQSVQAIVVLAAGDGLTMSVYQNGGTSKLLTVANGIAPSIWMTLIGRVP